MSRRPPVLVTGAPRSGTTWLARLLAHDPGASLAGREPMNPRGRQFALGGSVSRWTRVTDGTRRQTWALRSSYRGINPLVYSRYGHQQWLAPLPGRRLIVKDPFGLLSLPWIHRATGATPVVVFRPAGAVLQSYRRMGWQPDLDELRACIDLDGWSDPIRREASHLLMAGQMDGEVEQLAGFWNALHFLALSDLPDSAVVVSHREVAVGGDAASGALFAALGLDLPDKRATPPSSEATTSKPENTSRLHNFDRDPALVADGWKASLSDAEIAEIGERTSGIAARLEALALPLG